MTESKFTYNGRGTLDSMPEDKKKEYEESKKHVRRIFEDAMASGVVVVTSTKPTQDSERQHHDSAIFVNGTNIAETLGVLAMTIQRLQKLVESYLNNMMKEGSDNADQSRYIG